MQDDERMLFFFRYYEYTYMKLVVDRNLLRRLTREATAISYVKNDCMARIDGRSVIEREG